MQKIRKGDLIQVMVGKDKGRQGKVLKVLPKQMEVVVEDVNKVKKHHKSRGPNDPSRIIEVVKPLNWSKVQLVCPHCHQPTRVGIKINTQGKKVRYCKKCQQEIDS